MRRRVGFAFLGALSLAGPAGCGGAYDDLPRHEISGMVTLDGQPVAEGVIQFLPNGPMTGTQVGAMIRGGSYSIRRDEGPVPGTYRVTINAPTRVGKADDGPPSDAPPDSIALPRAKKAPAVQVKDMIPKQYNVQSTLTAEVKAEGPNTFNFDLKR
jgi:hypothetical protein